MTLIELAKTVIKNMDGENHNPPYLTALIEAERIIRLSRDSLGMDQIQTQDEIDKWLKEYAGGV